MKELELWQAKVIQLLHDPPGKPMATWFRVAAEKGPRRGHAALSRQLLEKLGAGEDTTWCTAPDRLVSAADRPNVGHARRCAVWGWHKHPLVTHPLSRAPLVLPDAPVDDADIDRETGRVFVPREANTATLSAIEALAGEAPGEAWSDVAALRRLYHLLWRSLRDRLPGDARARFVPALNAWEWIPADTRSPDVTIWDHTRMASALAFFDRGRKNLMAAGVDEPWLLSFTTGPVGRWIEQSRTSRDLWAGSFLLAELAWAAMRPIRDRYGPDAIIYPDLRRNPRADRWLEDQSEILGDTLPPGYSPRTRAAVIPNHWVAVVPRGGVKDLETVEEIGSKCVKAAEDRWREMANLVADDPRFKSALSAAAGDENRTWNWRAEWDRQHARVLTSTFVGVRWAWLAPPEERPGGGTLGQDPAVARAAAMAAALEPEMERAFGGTVGRETLTRMRRYLALSLAHHPTYYDGRGSLYALVHHHLQAAHAERKHARAASLPLDLPAGEACTVCKQRPVLCPPPKPDEKPGPEPRRAALRKFWKRLGKQEAIREPRFGQERLCAICLYRRVFVRLGKPTDTADPNRTWTGADPAWAVDRGYLRFPFPSTVSVAMQGWLLRLLGDASEGPSPAASLRSALERLNEAAERADWPRTMFRAALPRLGDAELPVLGPLAEDILELDPKVFVPNALEGELALRRRLEDGPNASLSPAEKELVAASKAVRQGIREFDEPERKGAEREARDGAGRRYEPVGAPPSRVAVLMLDGDDMGRLLLGEPDRMGARWRDVLHPQAVEQLARGQGLDPEEIAKNGIPWHGLLDEPRTTGPSLHAALSRMLVDFAHRVVPWVIEQEFSGRLVYTGGDDVLALLPADEAVLAAARLQQLYSAPWVVDTMPHLPFGDPPHRGARAGDVEWRWDAPRARGRFQIPVVPEAGRIDLAQCRCEPHVCKGLDGWGTPEPSTDLREGELFALPGPHQSLSAGIAIGHYKTPLHVLLRHARRLLDDEAKDRAGRAALAVGVFSRGGLKAQMAVRWDGEPTGTPTTRSDGARGLERLAGAQRHTRLVQAFRAGTLPGRLPGQLREQARILGRLLEADPPEALARGLFAHAGGGLPPGDARDDAERTWGEAWRSTRNRRRPDDPELSSDTFAEQVTGPFRVARALAREEEDGE